MNSSDKNDKILVLSMIAICLASFVLGIYFAFFGKLIYTGEVVVCDDRIDPQHCTGSMLPIGPILLDEVNRVYNIQIVSHTTSRENWDNVTVHLLDSGGVPLLGFVGEFYDEYWVEGGESGVEVVNSVDKRFKLTIPGQYYIDIETEKELLNKIPDVYTINIHTNSAYYEYFFIFAAIIGVLMAVWLKFKYNL